MSLRYDVSDLLSTPLRVADLMEQCLYMVPAFFQKYASGLDARGREHCELILRTARQILSLVEMINACIAAKEAPLQLEEFQLAHLLGAIRAEFSQQLEERGVQIVYVEELPSVVADRMGMTRIFRNLVDNALRYGGR